MTKVSITEFMRRNPDVTLGVAAWLLGLVTQLLLRPWLATGMGQAAAYLAIPTLWAQLVILAHRHRRRPSSQLVWIWLSAPLSLGYLIHGLMVFVMFLPRRV